MTIIHVVSVSGGKDSQATLLECRRKFPRARIIGITCDTDNESALTYAHIDYLRRAVGVEIVVLKADFTQRMAVKREYIARDARTRREYERRPKLDQLGNVIYKRRSNGEVAMRLVWTKDGPDIVADPVLVKRGGRRVRWSNKAKRRALAVLHPTGNVFLDLCLWKGRFPSRKAQFCTQELKTMLALEFQLDLVDQGYTVVSWQGIRRDESLNRRDAKKFERTAPCLYTYRPIVDWTAMDTIRFTQRAGVASNPLYSLGMNRVGCLPCINVAKGELRQIATRWPEELDRLALWEVLVGKASKRGYSTFMTDAHPAKDRRVIFAELNIRERVRWAFTTRGGRQFDLLGDLEESAACSSSLGMCE